MMTKLIRFCTLSALLLLAAFGLAGGAEAVV